MKKYVYRKEFYYFIIIVMFICICSLYLTAQAKANNILVLICIAALLLTIYGIICTPFTYCAIDGNKFVSKTIGFSQFIYLHEVKSLVIHQSSSLLSKSIIVYDETKKINITPWLKDYRELVSRIVDSTKDNHGILIDPVVLKILRSNEKLSSLP